MIRQVAIVSGKGGTGKTSLTAAFAQLAAPVVVVDADVDAADLHLVLAPHERERHDNFSLPVARISAENCMVCMACAHVCRFDAISNRDGRAIVDEAVCEGCRACALICPVKAISFHPHCTGAWMVADTAVGPLVHARLHPGAEHAGKLTTAVRDRGRALAADRNLDLVLIDGPPGIGCAATAAIAGVDLAVAVTELRCRRRVDLPVQAEAQTRNQRGRHHLSLPDPELRDRRRWHLPLPPLHVRLIPNPSRLRNPHAH